MIVEAQEYHWEVDDDKGETRDSHLIAQIW